MPRVKPVFRPTDVSDEAGRAAVTAMFAQLMPGVVAPAFDESHAGMAIAARNPQLALHLAKISGFLAGELPWSQRKDLRELAIQTVNRHYRCDYSFRARVPIAEAAGISRELQDSLGNWRASGLFDAEQRLVVEYAEGVVGGAVPAELFARAVTAFGEAGAVECTAVIAFWGFWAMLLNATAADLN
ncbi:MAG: hypothetical protein JF593_12860 [Novosphingobium sp.]|nr:hypothetical protein [Novosphingobium sp.]